LILSDSNEYHLSVEKQIGLPFFPVFCVVIYEKIGNLFPRAIFSPPSILTKPVNYAGIHPFGVYPINFTSLTILSYNCVSANIDSDAALFN
jgi:hypothetical protein